MAKKKQVSKAKVTIEVQKKWTIGWLLTIIIGSISGIIGFLLFKKNNLIPLKPDIKPNPSATFIFPQSPNLDKIINEINKEIRKK